MTKMTQNLLMTSLTQLITILLMIIDKCSTVEHEAAPPEPSAEEVKTALLIHEIFVDLGIQKYPQHLLQVNYGANHIMLGTKIPEEQTTGPPDSVNFTHYDYDTYYTLLTVGLDNPSKEDTEKRSFQHWVVGNIPENEFLHGECLVPYEWTDAPYSKGLHRVVFLLYKQPEKTIMVFDERHHMRSKLRMPRSYFNTTYFTTKYHLGDPVAVNFFISEIEEDHLVQRIPY